MLSPRVVVAFSTLSVIILFFFFSGPNTGSLGWFRSSSPKFPDFSRYVSLESLSPDQFPLDDINRRVIIVGDVHGMFERLQALLNKVSYNPSSDVLVSVGDIVAKGPHDGSMAVLDFMASRNITAVRGNHDEKVIEWRTWLNWVHSLPGGSDWLQIVHERWAKAQKHGEDDVDDWVEKQVRHDKRHRKWWRRIPDGWQLFGDHYWIAEKMTDEQYEYMVQRPLRIHVPHAHTFIAHAGILASNPKHKPGHKRQPLAHIPSLPDNVPTSESKTSILRRLQELAMLTDVPQNLLPWNTLNMRGVLKDHTVTRQKDGTPWSHLYKKDMKRCGGFDSVNLKKGTLPCHPSTVIYGHAASRGLDVKRWTIGLDSGCVYNRQMTALVLGGRLGQRPITPLDVDDDPFEYELGSEDGEALDIDGHILSSKVKYGDSGRGKIYSVSC